MGPDDLTQELRAHSPLVQCLTNFVSMDLVANLLNAAGASPAMVHDPEEAAELAGLASAVCVNIGTPSPRWVEGMHAAAGAAQERGIPWVLDPVAVGATGYRREIVAGLLPLGPTVIRGNASEVLALATQAGAGRGVDSTDDSEAVKGEAEALARTTGAVVVVSGPTDVITDGERTEMVRGGDDRMPLISALGCASSALVAASCAVIEDPTEAAVSAMALLAHAGEVAAGTAVGPGSLRVAILDALWATGELA